MWCHVGGLLGRERKLTEEAGCARLSGMLGTPGSWQREGGGSSPGREDKTESTGYGGTTGGKVTKLWWNVSEAVCWQIVRRIRVTLFLP